MKVVYLEQTVEVLTPGDGDVILHSTNAHGQSVSIILPRDEARLIAESVRDITNYREVSKP